jgi:hypothetical protein
MESDFWICLVETSVVNAQPKLLACLGDHNRDGQPPRVVDLPDEASIKQLFNLFLDKILSLMDCFRGLYWTGLTSG